MQTLLVAEFNKQPFLRSSKGSSSNKLHFIAYFILLLSRLSESNYCTKKYIYCCHIINTSIVITLKVQLFATARVLDHMRSRMLWQVGYFSTLPFRPLRCYIIYRIRVCVCARVCNWCVTSLFWHTTIFSGGGGGGGVNVETRLPFKV